MSISLSNDLLGSDFTSMTRRYPGFWIRSVADFIDSCILNFGCIVLGLMVVGILFWIGQLTQSSFVDLASPEAAAKSWIAQVFVVIARVCLSLVYYPWTTYRFGSTLGKRIFRIYVVDYATGGDVTWKQAWLRCLGYALSYLPMGAGFLMVGFQPEKRGLHDLIAGTVSVFKTKTEETIS